ncbi:MAG: glycerol-3-phosphate acyltransferase [Actinomycetota bacterium]
MTLKGVAWVVGAYLAGTLPSTYLIARARGGTEVLRLSARRESQADAHILMDKHMGKAWAAAAATLDVLKGLLPPLVARELGNVSPEWVAAAGVAAVVGHGWPPYVRAMAGRGLSTAVGVLLGLLPVGAVALGVIIVMGFVLRLTGPASTLGFVAVPVIEGLRGQPAAYVWMSIVILLVVFARRIEGITAVVRSGTPWPRALYYRAVHDISTPPD